MLYAGEGLTATLTFFSLVMSYFISIAVQHLYIFYISTYASYSLFRSSTLSIFIINVSCIDCIGVFISLIRKQPTIIIIGKTNIYQIFIKTLTGRKQAFNFEPENQVLAVKQALQEKEGIQVDQIRLIFSGKQLSDDRTLESYTINAGATIHMVLQLRGGGDDDGDKK